MKPATKSTAKLCTLAVTGLAALALTGCTTYAQPDTALLGGSARRRRERSWARARREARWERRTRMAHGRTRVYLARVARHGDDTEELDPAEPVGAPISTDDPAWHATVLEREALADERLFLLNRDISP